MICLKNSGEMTGVNEKSRGETSEAMRPWVSSFAREPDPGDSTGVV